MRSRRRAGWNGSGNSSGSSSETFISTSTSSSDAPRSGFSDAGSSKANHSIPSLRRCEHHPRMTPARRVCQNGANGTRSGNHTRHCNRSQRAQLARQELRNLVRHGTLSKIRVRISQSTGISSEYFRGVCVYGLLKMYEGCGYSARSVSKRATCEARVLSDLRKEAGDDAGRESCKAGLVKVIARVTGTCEGCIKRMSHREFRDSAVAMVRGLIRDRAS